MTPSAAIGVDIGGTTIKLGLVTEAGTVRARRRVPYRSLDGFGSLVAAIARMSAEMQAEAGMRATAIGIAAPGYARLEDGMMVDGTANVPMLRGKALAPPVEKQLGIPGITVNDGVAATMGELRWGAGQGTQRFALLTLGTGVGGGIAFGGTVVTGGGGIPPELGAIVLDDAAEGARTLEDFACARGFLAAYAARGGAAGSPEAIFAAARDGDPDADRALGAVSRRIAQAVGTLINVLNLEVCCLGGGIAQAGEALRGRVAAHLAEFTWPFLLARTELRLAETGNDAGILGAAAKALQIVGAPTGRPDTQ